MVEIAIQLRHAGREGIGLEPFQGRRATELTQGGAETISNALVGVVNLVNAVAALEQPVLAPS